MTEFSLGATRYRSRLLCAFDQWHLLNRTRPIIPALSSVNMNFRRDGGDLSEVTAALGPLADASDEDMLFVFRACTDACEQNGDTGWVRVDPMPGMADLMRLVTLVFAENFTPLFAMKRPDFKPIPYGGPSYPPVAMPDGEDWLFRPVLRGLCRAESLYDGTLRIERVAKLNDALDVADENEARARKAAEKR